jgi:hypothetical protein
MKSGARLAERNAGTAEMARSATILDDVSKSPISALRFLVWVCVIPR